MNISYLICHILHVLSDINLHITLDILYHISRHSSGSYYPCLYKHTLLLSSASLCNKNTAPSLYIPDAQKAHSHTRAGGEVFCDTGEVPRHHVTHISPHHSARSIFGAAFTWKSFPSLSLQVLFITHISYLIYWLKGLSLPGEELLLG